ncbi:MAG TPA: glycosyltransferase family 39 protein [Blastocatellia bacterium]|nr:glycosyltransferase family 39 protein [Blastocatellia bacterium]
MHTRAQEQGGMAAAYQWEAKSIVQGHGLLLFDNLPDNDERLLTHAPGYAMFLALVYKLFGGSFFTVQLVQNVLNSCSPVLIFLIASEVVAWRVGTVAGVLSAISHHLSYYSNVILPDSLCALPLLGAIYILASQRYALKRSIPAMILAGALISISIWLRPNALLMGPFLAVLFPITSAFPRKAFRRVWVLAILPFLLIAPITIRNYKQYGRFVLITSNTGIVLLEGIGDARGNPFRVPTNDVEIASWEADIYNNPEYAGMWWHPDLIERDRARIRMGLDIIFKHPFWYAKVVGLRMLGMFKFSAGAPLILRPGDRVFADAAAEVAEQKNGNLIPSREDIESDRRLPALGSSLSFFRRAARLLQRVIKESEQAFLAAGFLLSLALSRRRTLFLSLIPLYYLALQSLLHTEFRYTLPAHYFFLTFASIAWVLLGWVVWRIVFKAGGFLRQSRQAERT